jgi:hypothetical protein
MADTEELRDELLLLIGYLLTSAHGLFQEPQSYGPARLLETAGRLLDLMEEQGLLDDSLQDLRAAIDRERYGPEDEEGFPDRVNNLALRWTESMAGRF